ncbi:hypothetical protein CHS0354_039481, partial [Potamilus streckersoni]
MSEKDPPKMVIISLQKNNNLSQLQKEQTGRDRLTQGILKTQAVNQDLIDSDSQKDDKQNDSEQILDIMSSGSDINTVKSKNIENTSIESGDIISDTSDQNNMENNDNSEQEDHPAKA